MSRSGLRRHRLPQHCDYVLIPPPQDFSPPDEKSPLPAIIVTPSSPSSSIDFSIAFLAPPPKPTLRERVATAVTHLHTKARIVLVLAFLLFVLAIHLLAHRLATRHPKLQFDTLPASITRDTFAHVPSAHIPVYGSSRGSGVGWFDWQGFWQTDERDFSGRHDFIVTEDDDAPVETPGPSRNDNADSNVSGDAL